MNFGKWIVVAFIFFALFIATLVTVCMHEDSELVSKNYYAEELQHQKKIEKISNAKALADVPLIQAINGKVTITYAELAKVERGMLTLIRPSDPGLDHSFELKPVSGTSAAFLLPTWNSGLYRASLEWTQAGKSFYIEELIVL